MRDQCSGKGPGSEKSVCVKLSVPMAKLMLLPVAMHAQFLSLLAFWRARRCRRMRASRIEREICRALFATAGRMFAPMA
ncbi:hypothetical protein D3C85_866650 [compost metagenome]